MTLQKHIENFCPNTISINDVQESVAHTNAVYGGLNRKGIAKIIIIDGENDPWRSTSVQPTSGRERDGVDAHVIKAANHCPPAVEIIEQTLNKWLKPAFEL